MGKPEPRRKREPRVFAHSEADAEVDAKIHEHALTFADLYPEYFAVSLAYTKALTGGESDDRARARRRGRRGK